MDSPAAFEDTFAIAKQALQFIGRYKTAPTPAVYEVWYRFVEGNSENIGEQLNHAIDEAGCVTDKLLEDLYNQFCREEDATSGLSNRLESEMKVLQSAINQQIDAGEQLGESIDQANQGLSSPNVSSQQVEQFVADLVASNSKMQNQLEATRTRLDESQNQISALKKDLMNSQKTTMTDPLTGVGNRRCFEALMESAISERELSVAGFAVLVLIDLDKFKQVNDTHGHAVGDHLLQFTASSIQDLRSDATVARYGGDEFGVFVKVQTANMGQMFAEQIRDLLTSNPLRHTTTGAVIGDVTASIGVAILRDDDTRETWFERADSLLMNAKEAGRNCVRAERQLNR